ncbi:MAG TPA: hypothetical protein VMM14_08070 [Acidimicrobiia bacterium]|nr:hypothetical protein [Acidimicrobiia bacterium]
MATISSPTVRVGERRIPLVLPNRRDPRLHTAAVIISIHVIGITALGFRVSVPQIVAAIVTAAGVDVALTLRMTGKLVWPASGMLTGSGVALILRLAGMGAGDSWSWAGWHYFAGIAGVSVLTKYLIRFRGEHLFNPSNFGLVVAFLVLGSDVIEPLDFWWAPLDFWMALAYAVIIGGGIAITRRLNLLEMAVVYWVVLAAGLAILVASGHCMTAVWSVDPVCGTRFWTVLVTSPEVLIFMLFMITDPKTVPRGRLARFVFAATLGLLTTLLMAPQSVEFGAKVALLASLVIWSPARGLFDRFLPDRASGRSGLVSLMGRVLDRRREPLAGFTRGALAGSFVVLAAVGIIAAGAPARLPPDSAAAARTPVIEVDIDPDTLPTVEIHPDVRSLNLDVDDRYARELAVNLAENLAIEAEAVRRGDGSLLAAASGGERLTEMQERVAAAIAAGSRVVPVYHFKSLTLGVSETEGSQVGAALAFEGTGTVELVTYSGLGEEQSRSETRFSSTLIMRQLGGERWVIVEVTDPPSG